MNTLCKECGVTFEDDLNNRKYCSETCRKSVRSKLQYKYRGRRVDTIERCYTKYKYSASRRGISFSLTLEEFSQYWQKNCYYCDNNISTIGIDRSDSSDGYHADNVLPCCTKCNTMKWDMNTSDFINRCKRIADKFS